MKKNSHARRSSSQDIFRMRVYKQKPPVKRAAQIVLTILLILLAIAIILFFWMWHNAVYLPDGTVEIVTPWGNI